MFIWLIVPNCTHMCVPEPWMTRQQTVWVCRCHYTGRLTNGSVFDSSYGRRPLQFKACRPCKLHGNVAMRLSVFRSSTHACVPPVLPAGARDRHLVLAIHATFHTPIVASS